MFVNTVDLKKLTANVLPHIAGKCFVDDTRFRLLGSAESKMECVEKPRQEVNGVTLD